MLRVHAPDEKYPRSPSKTASTQSAVHRAMSSLIRFTTPSSTIASGTTAAMSSPAEWAKAWRRDSLNGDLASATTPMRDTAVAKTCASQKTTTVPRTLMKTSREVASYWLVTRSMAETTTSP